jgi:hypothetical protein
MGVREAAAPTPNCWPRCSTWWSGRSSATIDQEAARAATAVARSVRRSCALPDMDVQKDAEPRRSGRVHSIAVDDSTEEVRG